MSQHLIVQKFGGSSLSDVDKLKRVADKIVATKKTGVSLVVVVSAMGDTTDDLLSRAREVSTNPARRELDMLLSVGERISMALLSMAIEEAGFKAISLTGSQCGIITTDSHTSARVIDVRPFRVQDELEKGHVVIVAGYQGTSYRREVTTLGRGGSDTTAVALAAALSADCCEIYSDVDGVFSADPRVVVSAEKLDTLSYEEMQDLARSGAKVLNDQAVEFARRNQIALYAKSTHKDGSQGTVIRPDGADRRAAIRVSAVSHVGRGFWIDVDFDPAAQTLEHVRFSFIDWSGERFRGFATLEDIHDEEELARSVERAGGTCVERGMVTIVGVGIGGSVAFAARGNAIAANSVHRYISANRVSWVIACNEVADVAIAVHREFVEST